MTHYSNGIAAGEIAGAKWRKSRASAPTGTCVEMTGLPDGGAAVRNSRDPEGPALIYTRDEVEAFLVGVKSGDFDFLL
ncbi:DUF397 domain-containing protein [Streptomyces sp. MS19]|uniref:DUF397 domain-containing protein n=1 Tax=Streptomyces sp. MS19 TaxID=3385972 RepID=UPI0039A23AA4